MGGHRHVGGRGRARRDVRRLTAAGGITTRQEIDALDAMGIDAVVGMAIYTGALDLDGLQPEPGAARDN